jgi:hypothetical protein
MFRGTSSTPGKQASRPNGSLRALPASGSWVLPAIGHAPERARMGRRHRWRFLIAPNHCWLRPVWCWHAGTGSRRSAYLRIVQHVV